MFIVEKYSFSLKISQVFFFHQCKCQCRCRKSSAKNAEIENRSNTRLFSWCWKYISKTRNFWKFYIASIFSIRMNRDKNYCRWQNRSKYKTSHWSNWFDTRAKKKVKKKRNRKKNRVETKKKMLLTRFKIKSVEIKMRFAKMISINFDSSSFEMQKFECNRNCTEGWWEEVYSAKPM